MVHNECINKRPISGRSIDRSMHILTWLAATWFNWFPLSNPELYYHLHCQTIALSKALTRSAKGQLLYQRRAIMVIIEIVFQTNCCNLTVEILGSVERVSMASQKSIHNVSAPNPRYIISGREITLKIDAMRCNAATSRSRDLLIRSSHDAPAELLLFSFWPPL